MFALIASLIDSTCNGGDNLSMTKSPEHVPDSFKTPLTTHDFEQDIPMLMISCVKYMWKSLNAHFSEA